MKSSLLEQLRPTERRLVMDLVHEAGIDVSDWQNYNGKHAASNPKYCYEWVFPGEDRLAACLWFSNLEIAADGRIFQRINLWPIIKRHKNKGGRPSAARRARALDEALQRAFRLGITVHVIVVDGEQADIEKEPDTSSMVKSRLLDPEPWSVSTYDWNTGECVLTRGALASPYIDQFSIVAGAEPQRDTRVSFVYERSARVRQSVLDRAAGCCEYCEAKGFETSTGSIYLETHHVVPLCENGEDSTSNVAALCPDHHRQAHFGKDRDLIREVLLERLRGTLME